MNQLISRREALSTTAKVALAIGIGAAIGAAGIGTGVYYATLRPPTKPEEKKLVVYHWWTAGGEREALDAVYALYRKYNPGYEIIDNPAAGGGGAVMRAAVKAMLLAGQPPDTCQVTYGPGMVHSWYVYHEPIDDLFKDFPVPETLKQWAKVGDHYWLMPLNIHRDNNLWYNISLVKKIGIDVPIKSVNEFFEACEKAKKAGYIPLAFGTVGGQRFWLNYIFECFVMTAPHGGGDYLNNFNLGKAKPASDPAVREALENMKILWQNYVNPDYGALTWDEAGKMLMRNEAVFNIMGDWQKGHFMASGWKPDVDFGWQTFPGTEGLSMVHGDSFGIIKDAPHPTAARKWVELLKTVEAQEAFCIIKGASPPRIDVPLDRFDPMQRRIAESIRKDKIVIGGHGEVEAWMDKGGEIFERFVTTYDVDATIDEIDKAYREIFPKPLI
jgi:glucose/mannose transport system substrate-binding protein